MSYLSVCGITRSDVELSIRAKAKTAASVVGRSWDIVYDCLLRTYGVTSILEADDFINIGTRLLTSIAGVDQLV